MTTDQIRYFLALANRLNFRAVADRFFITQPTLSRQIAMLEDELSVKLFERSKRGVELTKAGKTLYAGLPDIYQSLTALVNETKETAAKGDHYLSIAIQDDQLPSEEVQWTIQQFMAAYPETHISLNRVPVKEVFDGLMNHRYDLVNCLALYKQYLQNFSCVTLSLDESCIAIQRELATRYSGHILPAEVDELSRQLPIHLIAIDHFEMAAEPIQALRESMKLTVDDSVCHIEGNFSSMALKVGAGICITSANSTHVMKLDPNIRLIPVKGASPHRKVLVYLDPCSNPAVPLFLELLSKAKSEPSAVE